MDAGTIALGVILSVSVGVLCAAPAINAVLEAQRVVRSGQTIVDGIAARRKAEKAAQEAKA